MDNLDLYNQYGTDLDLINRRRKIAEALIQRGQQTPQGQMTGRFYVAPNPLQYAAGLANQYVGKQNLDKTDADQRDLSKRFQADTVKAIADYERTKSGTPDTPLDPATTQQYIEGGIEPKPTPGTPPNPRAAVSQALLNPFLKNSPLLAADIKQQEAEKLLRLNKELTAEEAARAREENDRNRKATSPFTVGDDGKPVANKEVQDYEIRKASAGRAITAEVTKRGQDMTDARARELASPDFKSKVANEVAFTKGKQADALRSISVAHDHLDTWEKAATALQNGDTQGWNKLSAYVGKQFGVAAPTNLEAMAKIVGPEIVKAVVPGGGGVGEREQVVHDLGVGLSPGQQHGVAESYRALMLGQADGLKRQYLSGGGSEESFKKKLSPQMTERMGMNEAPASNVLRFDSQGNLIK
jgi:hypothetical protein